LNDLRKISDARSPKVWCANVRSALTTRTPHGLDIAAKVSSSLCAPMTSRRKGWLAQPHRVAGRLAESCGAMTRRLIIRQEPCQLKKENCCDSLSQQPSCEVTPQWLSSRRQHYFRLSRAPQRVRKVRAGTTGNAPTLCLFGTSTLCTSNATHVTREAHGGSLQSGDALVTTNHLGTTGFHLVKDARTH